MPAWLNPFRFVESLSAKIYSEPPSIEQLSELFQAFYLRAGSAISVHISTLLSRVNRESSPAPSKSAFPTRGPIKKPSVDSVDTVDNVAGGQQMLTASEVYEKKRTRKLLEYKRLLLEEAVEKTVCERVYEKIWQHKNTLDEVQDEKLRSKTAALALVGIGLRDLGIEFDPECSESPEDVQESLGPAREKLAKMNEEHCPLGKLQHLTQAHKSIVDTLFNIHPSTSSADEILPTLIYTLISSPMEGISVVSNLAFIQRFRNSTKIDGEAAYCLTNLEAAISFLENVDLASLRMDGLSDESERRQSQPLSPTTDKSDFLSKAPPTSPRAPTTTTAVTKSDVSATTLQTPVPVQTSRSDSSDAQPATRRQRALSNLFQPPAKVIGAANDVVRNTAEEGFKNISSTLDNSFKFLFGKLREQSNKESDVNVDVVLPRTLDEARQLVSRPVTPHEDGILSEASSIVEKEVESPQPLESVARPDDRFLGLFAGGTSSRRPGSLRDHSVDSVRSSGSAAGTRRPVAYAATGTPSDPTSGQKPVAMALPSQASSTNPLDSVRNLGNTLGSALGGGFRAAFSSSPTPLQPHQPSPSSLSVHKSIAGETIHTEPPIQRYVELEDSSELLLKDIPVLLKDYQRLAQVLKGLSQS